MAAVDYHYGQFPPQDFDFNQLMPLVGPANRAIARYDGLLSAIPNASVLLSPLTTQEAVLSSRIEGTQATMGEVLEYEAEGNGKFSQEKRDDIQEVLNYRKAMRHAMHVLNKLPLSQRMILEVHKVLMDSVRGHGKAPGQYRKIPNWIGPAGCSIDEAYFIPISADKLPDGMSSFEQYIHSENVPDALIQLAVLHAEFESLHPFLDGNGRLGRMLIPLFLWQKELIHEPMFYVSAYFERNREEYYERLRAVSTKNDWTGWCKFFLKAVTEQASENEEKAKSIIDLYNSKKSELVELTHSQYGILALDWIFERPIFRTTDFIKSANIPKQTARRILNQFRDTDWLTLLEEPSGQKPAIYGFAELLNIAEGKSIL